MNDQREMLVSAVQKGGGELPLLVRKHLDWVYSLCRRSVRDAALAEDVTQTVFMVLIKKAKHLPQGVNMSGWLFNTARYCCRCALRDEHTRRRHELAAAKAPESVPDVPNPEEELLRLLDEHLAALGESDRAAVLLRYYQRCSFAEVGMHLDISEEAAKKRVRRAVEKLRARMAASGVLLGADALTAILTEKIVQPAPAKLAAAVLAHATHGAAAMALSAGQKKLLARLAMKTAGGKVAIGTAAVLLVAGLVATGVAVVLAIPNRPAPLPPKIAAIPPSAPVAPALAATAKPPMLTQAQWAAVFQAYARKIRALSVRATFVTRYYISGREIRNLRAIIQKSDPKHLRQAMVGETPGWHTQTEAANLKWDVSGRLVNLTSVNTGLYYLPDGTPDPNAHVQVWVIGRKKVWSAYPDGGGPGREWRVDLYNRQGKSGSDWRSAWNGVQFSNPEMQSLESLWTQFKTPFLYEPAGWRKNGWFRKFPPGKGPLHYRLISQKTDPGNGHVKLVYAEVQGGNPLKITNPGGNKWVQEIRYDVKLVGGLRVYRESSVLVGPQGKVPDWQNAFSIFVRNHGIWFPRFIRERLWSGSPAKRRHLSFEDRVAITRLSVDPKFSPGTFVSTLPFPSDVWDHVHRVEYDTAPTPFAPEKLVPVVVPTAHLKGFAMPGWVIERFVPPKAIHRLSAVFSIKNTAGKLADFQLRPQDNAVTVAPPAFTLFPGGSQKIRVTMKKPPGDRPYCFYLSLKDRRAPPSQRKLSTTVPVFFLPSPALGAQPGSIILNPRNFAARQSFSITLQFLRPLGGSAVVDMIKPGSRSVAVSRWSQKSMDVVIKPAAGAAAIFSHITVRYTYNGHLEKMRIPVIGLVHR